MTLPNWPPRDWRAILALFASVGGAAILTGFAAWLVNIIWRGGWHGFEEQRLAALSYALFGVLLIMGIVLVSLGMAINKRSVKGSFMGANFEAEGGDDDGHVAP
jgi:hypothetical protein